MSLQSVRNGEVSTNAGGLIIWPAKALLLAGFALLFFQGMSEIIKKIAVMTGLMDDPTPFVSAHQAAELEAGAGRRTDRRTPPPRPTSIWARANDGTSSRRTWRRSCSSR